MRTSMHDDDDVLVRTRDAYDSWFLHVDSDARDRVQATRRVDCDDYDLVVHTHDAYDSWLLLAESDERNLQARPPYASAYDSPLADCSDYDLIARTHDAYDSWRLHVESDERNRCLPTSDVSNRSDEESHVTPFIDQDGRCARATGRIGRPVRFTDAPTCRLCEQAHASNGSVRLSCGHCFHASCIAHHDRCPLSCR